VPHLRARLAFCASVAFVLGGCGTSGYGTVDTHQLVLLARALPPAPAARRTGAALACGARAEARHLHRALRLARPRSGAASAQIAVADAVTAEKPGGVIIIPVASNPMLAPILSMRRAGIRVVPLSPSATSSADAAAEGARAVLGAVGLTQREARSRAASTSRLLAPCVAAH
jgi:hypothetical protein